MNLGTIGSWTDTKTRLDVFVKIAVSVECGVFICVLTGVEGDWLTITSYVDTGYRQAHH